MTALPTITTEPIAVTAKQAATLVGISVRSWRRRHAAGECPAPVKLGGHILWNLSELREWVAAGCPSRARWSERRIAQPQG